MPATVKRVDLVAKSACRRGPSHDSRRDSWRERPRTHEPAWQSVTRLGDGHIDPTRLDRATATPTAGPAAATGTALRSSTAGSAGESGTQREPLGPPQRRSRQFVNDDDPSRGLERRPPLTTLPLQLDRVDRATAWGPTEDGHRSTMRSTPDGPTPERPGCAHSRSLRTRPRRPPRQFDGQRHTPSRRAPRSRCRSHRRRRTICAITANAATPRASVEPGGSRGHGR